MLYRLFRQICCICYLLSCPVMGQGLQKKHITKADFDQWGTLSINEISEQGNWVSYSMNYTTHADTLFLQHTSSKKNSAYPMGKQHRFGGERLFAFMTGDDLTVRNLQTGTVQILQSISRYDLPLKGKYFLTLNKEGVLHISKDVDNVIEKIEGVTEYKMNDDGTGLLYVKKVKEEYLLGCIDLDHYQHTILSKSTSPITRIVWQEEGKMVCFMDGNGLGCYHVNSKATYRLTSTQLATMGVHAKVSAYGQIVISKDDEKVFFKIGRAHV